MENVTLFLCDIHGTYIKNSEPVSKKEIKKLLENLEKLRIINNSKKIIFSFVSAECEMLVKKESVNLELNNIYENVEMGIQFFDNGHFNYDEIVYNEPQGKISQMLFYFNQIQADYFIDKVYYADDTDIYHFMLSNLLMNSPLEDKFQSIIPDAKDGLEELNNIMFEIIETETYQMKK